MRFLWFDPNAVLQFIILFKSNVLWQMAECFLLTGWLVASFKELESFRKDAEIHVNSKESGLNTAPGEFI